MTRIDIQFTEIQIMKKIPMTKTKPNLVETKKLVVKEHPDIQPREKQDDDADPLSEENPCVKKHVRVVAVGVEMRTMWLTE
jgi:hypothetical protein